ncbi:hypothetical protein ACFVFS_11840 [Kitasatospora sp. NPDC057692]|uniref:hypothetical protein n=1 Tax=Kitasatospora sp. NPDC057692 TaxID=3346215 RepID=UPI003675244B
MGRSVRWVGPAVATTLTAALAVAGVAGYRWLSEGNGHPFGDERACAGTDVPLERALEARGITLPPDATDVHYTARAHPADGEPRLAVAFRSTRQAMSTHLTANGLDAGRLTRLDEGPFAVGDVFDVPPGTCGNTGRAPAVAIPQGPTPTGTAYTVAVELDGHAIRSTTAVLLTVPSTG